MRKQNHLSCVVLQRIYIAKGNGVTIDYIIKKGSACVEAFRRISHLMAQFFGNPDRHRGSKEMGFQEDMRVLVEELDKRELGGEYKTRLVPVSGKGKKAAKLRAKGTSAITDVYIGGIEIWSDKFEEWKEQTTYDPALGYPSQGNEGQDRMVRTLNNGTVFDDPNQLHLTFDSGVDLGILAEHETAGVGGGDELEIGDTD